MRWVRLLLAVVLMVPGSARAVQAQDKDEAECECPTPWGRVQVWPRVQGENLFWFDQQARLGIWVQSEANPETDRYGAVVERVMEGGPAERAGLQEGDIITKLAGESLLSGDETYDDDLSTPGMRLVERARKLESGDTVEVEYRRDGDTKTTEVVAGDFDEGLRVGRVLELEDLLSRSDRMRGLFERYRDLPKIEMFGPESFALKLARLPGVELVSLNAQLGEYFGTDEGVLVVSVPEDSELNLEAGDVIQSIDGREVRSPSHAMRILRSYDADEEISFQILRKKRETTITGKVSAAERGTARVRIRRY